jgi:hypothetical protein
MVGQPTRQRAVVDRIGERIAVIPQFAAAILIGSLAAGTAAAASDVDLIVCPAGGQFAAAWARRADLHVTGALVCWDNARTEVAGIAAHRWVTDDMVYVEALFGEPDTGIRLAPPWRLIAGDRRLAGRYPKRPPIDRAAEFSGRQAAHPVDLAFEDLKAALRSEARAAEATTFYPS